MFFKKRKSLTPTPHGITHIVVGLGNPGPKYETTRHNIGFMAADRIAENCRVRLTRLQFKSLCAPIQIHGIKALLMKPQTYMNNSGEAVRDAMAYYKIPPENVIVIFDDVTLEPGVMRLRRKGSDGGHNGMKSIIYLSGSDQFPRVKIGVGKKPHPDYDLADWVLSRFTKKELAMYDDLLDDVFKAVGLILCGKMDEAMGTYNG